MVPDSEETRMEWWVDGVGDALIEMKAPRCGGWGVRHLKPEGIPFWNGIQPPVRWRKH